MPEFAHEVWAGHLPTVLSLYDGDWSRGTLVSFNPELLRTFILAFDSGTFHDYEVWTNGTDDSILVGVIFFGESRSAEYGLYWNLGRNGTNSVTLGNLEYQARMTKELSSMPNRWLTPLRFGAASFMMTAGFLLGHIFQ